MKKKSKKPTEFPSPRGIAVRYTSEVFPNIKNPKNLPLCDACRETSEFYVYLGQSALRLYLCHECSEKLQGKLSEAL